MDLTDTTSTSEVQPEAAPERPPFRCLTKVWLERGGKVALSQWRIELLEAVADTGSLTRGAERVGVPYRTAWYKIKGMEENLGVRLLTTQSGGADGGHSELTPEAHDLLTRFRHITSGISELVQARFQSELEELLG